MLQVNGSVCPPTRMISLLWGKMKQAAVSFTGYKLQLWRGPRLAKRCWTDLYSPDLYSADQLLAFWSNCVNPDKFHHCMRLSAKCCKFVFLCLQHLEGNLQSGVNNFSKALMSPEKELEVVRLRKIKRCQCFVSSSVSICFSF